MGKIDYTAAYQLFDSMMKPEDNFVPPGKLLERQALRCAFDSISGPLVDQIEALQAEIEKLKAPRVIRFDSCGKSIGLL